MNLGWVRRSAVLPARSLGKLGGCARRHAYSANAAWHRKRRSVRAGFGARCLRQPAAHASCCARGTHSSTGEGAQCLRRRLGDFRCQVETRDPGVSRAAPERHTWLSAPVIIDAHGSWEPGPQTRSWQGRSIICPKRGDRPSDLFAFKASFYGSALGRGFFRSSHCRAVMEVWSWRTPNERQWRCACAAIPCVRCASEILAWRRACG